MRRLIYVPIIHAETDLGSLAGSVRKAHVARFGKDAWDRHVRAIEQVWKGIQVRVLSLGLEYTRVKVYQDGLPVCGLAGPAWQSQPGRASLLVAGCWAEEAIVRDLARGGSPNHQLVSYMLDLGATLVGTEDPRLLVRQYHEMKAALTGRQGARTPDGGRGTLEERDRFVAERIRTTLREGETGILFMGLAHQVDRLLAGDTRMPIAVFRLPIGTDGDHRGSAAGRGRHGRTNV